MEARSCPECGETIKGRADKRFCSDMCRNAFNNKQNSDSNNYVRNLNNILRKNRRILEEVLVGEKTTVAKQKLVDKGFNFGFNTHRHTTINKHVYTFCYEYGYLPLNEKDLILVIKRKVD